MRTTLLCICILVPFFTNSCSSHTAAETVIVFSGAGMTEPMTELAELYRKQTGVVVLNDFQGSGRLSAKIESGQRCDIFIPASSKWFNRINENKIVAHNFILALHQPVLIFSKEGQNSKSFSDLLSGSVSIALGDPDATAIGSVSLKMLNASSIKVEDINLKGYALTVKQLVQWVENGSVDAAIVWRADACKREGISIVVMENSGTFTDEIPACLMQSATAEAEEYYTFLQKRGPGIFEKYGYTLTAAKDE